MNLSFVSESKEILQEVLRLHFHTATGACGCGYDYRRKPSPEDVIEHVSDSIISLGFRRVVVPEGLCGYLGCVFLPHTGDRHSWVRRT